MSKLIVEVCKISKSEKHPNADKLSIVEFEGKGWQCITSLNQYKPGDLVVYCPPDSIIPEKIIEQFNLEFLKKNGRVGTIKLRGSISQGLVLDCPTLKGRLKAGTDVAKLMGITKYEVKQRNQSLQASRVTFKKLLMKYVNKQISLRRFIAKTIGLIRDSFKPKKNPNPFFNKYTDIDNIKNYSNIFVDGDEVIITEKIHGTSFRAGKLPIPQDKWWHRFRKAGYEFIYGSHNIQLNTRRGKNCFYGEDVYGQIADKYKLAEIIAKDFILYGEIYGMGVQDLSYGMEFKEVVFFDAKYKGQYLNYVDFVGVCKLYNLPMAPVLYRGKYNKEIVKKYTEGNSLLNYKNGGQEQIREGCVIKPIVEHLGSRIGRKILKSINPEYLIKKNRTEFK